MDMPKREQLAQPHLNAHIATSKAYASQANPALADMNLYHRPTPEGSA